MLFRAMTPLLQRPSHVVPAALQITPCAVQLRSASSPRRASARFVITRFATQPRFVLALLRTHAVRLAGSLAPARRAMTVSSLFELKARLPNGSDYDFADLKGKAKAILILCVLLSCAR